MRKITNSLKKILIYVLIFMLLFNFIIPNTVMASEKQQEDIVSSTTGLDTFTGYMLEPTVKFFTDVIDAIMSVFSSIMEQQDLEFVMLSKDDIGKIQTKGETGASFPISDMSPYESATGSLKHLKYPNFPYSPEEIFAGKIDLLDINFITSSNDDEGWKKIRSVISQWYQILRMIAIIGLLSVLIYTGIKIILSSTAGDKAKYKQMLTNWLVAVILAFTMHYIMAFILSVIGEFTNLLNGATGLIQVDAGGTQFQTNLIGLARFQIQKQLFSAKIGHLIIYTALVIYTFKFTFLYFKRVLKMAFLTIISPIVALTYPIDKMDGQATGFNMWLKEFIFNALLQPMHYILYYILISSSLSLAANNPIYGIAALMFMSYAEKLLKKIFGFGKARLGTVGGIAGAFATGALTSSLINYVKNPLHPFGGGKSDKSGSSNSSESLDDYYVDFREDTTEEDTLLDLLRIDSNTQNTSNTEDNTIVQDIEKFFERYRQALPISVSELGGLSYDNDGYGSFEDILKLMAEYYRTGRNPGTMPGLENLSYEDLKNLLRSRVDNNEMQFLDNNMQFQYIDGDSRTSSEMLEEIMRLNAMATNPMVASNERRNYIRQSERLLKKLKRRMAQNEYIQRNGGPVALKQQEEARINEAKNTTGQPEQRTQEQKTEQTTKEPNAWEKFKQQPVTKGVARVGEKVGKTIIKPVWDVEKGLDWKYNGKRLVGNILKGTVGVTAGVAAAAVQAGISITDGKYKAMEGIATVGAGMAGVSHLAKKAGNKIEENREDHKSLERYSERWFNRDDVISNYNKEYPGNGKDMRRRAVNNYVSRGITDFKEQKQAMKYANILKEERGLDEEEADKIAVATLQYKKSLTKNNSYMVLFDEKQRKKYIDIKADAYSGSASKDSIRQLHENLIQNVRDFDRANQ